MTRKPEDPAAARIRWGVELETMIPAGCEVSVGHYHLGLNVTSGLTPKRERVLAPSFAGIPLWQAERDNSIQPDPGFDKCEFVSPILSGERGVVCLRDFVRFALQIGAKVNTSCGCHITVGVPSIIGASDVPRISRFIRSLARLVTRHAWAIYAQTGTARHRSNYAQALPDTAGQLTNQLLYQISDLDRSQLVHDCGRGLVNFRKAFPSDLTKSAVEFRVFAGTLNEKKLLHHLATVLGLCRRAATAKAIPPFSPPSSPSHLSYKKPQNAPDALRLLWRYLGWADDSIGADCAFGQFGTLYHEFPTYSGLAMRKAIQFEARYPAANL